jgi:hypothetical protein
MRDQYAGDVPDLLKFAFLRTLTLNLVLALCACSPLCWQPLWGQTLSGGVQAGKKQPDDRIRSGKATDTRGAKENPLVADTLGHQLTPEERKEAEKQATKAEAEEPGPLVHGSVGSAKRGYRLRIRAYEAGRLFPSSIRRIGALGQG